MAVRLDQLEQQRIAAKPPDSLEAYELVLRGRKLLGEGHAGEPIARRARSWPRRWPRIRAMPRPMAALGQALFD